MSTQSILWQRCSSYQSFCLILRCKPILSGSLEQNHKRLALCALQAHHSLIDYVTNVL